jgi:histone-lysine N-methyltransferase SETMAR
MDEHKRVHLDICSRHLAPYYKEGDNFLQWIITDDNTWIHHYQSETKKKSMQWKHLSSPVVKKFKTQPSAGKLVLKIFWDFQGPTVETYLEYGKIVTSAIHCDMLQKGVKPAICSKRRRSLSEGILLLDDNSCCHTAACTLEILRKLKWKVMEHPAHSPDLAPSDFHLFGPFKEALGWRRFQCDKDVKNAVHQWLRAQPKTLYYDGIKKLAGHWKKCTEKQGEYVVK